jgi:DNA-binding transcriptional MerR regulator
MVKGSPIFGPKDVCQQVGISFRQLTYWCLIGVVKPQIRRVGQKSFRRFTMDDVQHLKKVKDLTAVGFMVSKASKRVKMVRDSVVGPLTGEGEETLSKVLTLSVVRERWEAECARAVRFGWPAVCIGFKVGTEDLKTILTILGRVKRRYDLLGTDHRSLVVWLLLQSDEQKAGIALKRILPELQSAVPYPLPYHLSFWSPSSDLDVIQAALDGVG